MFTNITTLAELEDDDESTLVWGKAVLTVTDVTRRLGKRTSTVAGWFYEGWFAEGDLQNCIIAQRWSEEEECEALEFPYDDWGWHGGQGVSEVTLEMTNAEWLVPGARVLLTGYWRMVKWESFDETVSRGMDGPVVTQYDYSGTEVHAYAVYPEKWGTPRPSATDL